MWNYIIIGGGSAGCVLANRLSENPGNKVLLLEAGAGGKESLPMVKAPGGVMYLSDNSLFDWSYAMQADPTCDNYAGTLGAGKLLGGGSSINGMMFIRGNAEDFNEWAELGNIGWSYEEVLPYFKKMENTGIGTDQYHGRSGPLGVEYATPMLDVSHRFIEAAVESGLNYNADINGEIQDGISRTPCSTLNGIRQSTAITYLKPAIKRNNLKVVTGVLVNRVLFEGKKATGVEFSSRGRTRVEKADGEIILSAGAVRSPQILMLSGIGPQEQLSKFNIPVVLAHEGVGGNHMEHPAAYMTYEVSLPTWGPEVSLLKQARHGLNWLFRKRGPANSGMSQAVAFVRTDENLDRPDIQLSFIPIGLNPRMKHALDMTSGKEEVLVIVNDCQPGGRGRLELASADPRDQALVFPRLLATDTTVKRLTAAVKRVRNIFNAGAIKPFVKQETAPGNGVNTEAEIETWLRSSVIDTVHPCGTCKMGQDELAVVDERLRVRHVDNLRVIDASIMPTITTGNTNAPTIMIAEKGAAMIIEDKA